MGIHDVAVDKKVDEKEKIAQVLLDSGEARLNDLAKTVEDYLDAGGNALDEACLTNVLVVRTKSGKFLVGEFGFEFREVTEEEAIQVVSDFGGVDEEG